MVVLDIGGGAVISTATAAGETSVRGTGGGGGAVRDGREGRF